MADSMQPKHLNINDNIDESTTVIDTGNNLTTGGGTSPGHLGIILFSTFVVHVLLDKRIPTHHLMPIISKHSENNIKGQEFLTFIFTRDPPSSDQSG